MFAKLFERGAAQCLVKLDSDEKGPPEVRVYFEPEGMGVCTAAISWDKDTDETWEKAEAAFTAMDATAAWKIAEGVCEKLGSKLANIEEPTAPPPLLEGYKQNFETLKRVARNNDLALVSAIRKADQKPVALVCGMSRLGNGDLMPVPFAVMVEGDPFELFEDPTVGLPDE